jgi:hypothetical protein
MRYCCQWDSGRENWEVVQQKKTLHRVHRVRRRILLEEEALTFGGHVTTHPVIKGCEDLSSCLIRVLAHEGSRGEENKSVILGPPFESRVTEREPKTLFRASEFAEESGCRAI